MAFAIRYNTADTQALINAANTLNLSGQDRNYWTRVWNGGLSGWQTAPPCPAQYADNDPDCRQIVITYGTLADLRAFLYKYAPQAPILAALADDMGGSSGATEPWPPA